MPEGPFDASSHRHVGVPPPDPAKTLSHVRGALRAGALGFIVTPHPAWRLPISIAEALRIKRLRPAFGYRNGARRVIEVAALAGGLTVREMTWVYDLWPESPSLRWRRTRRRRRAGTQRRAWTSYVPAPRHRSGRAAGGEADAASPRAGGRARSRDATQTPSRDAETYLGLPSSPTAGRS